MRLKYIGLPPWIEGHLKDLSLGETRLLILLYAHADDRERKVWCYAKTLLENRAISRTTFGVNKISLAKKGFLCFRWNRRLSGGHVVYMAVNAPRDFRIGTAGPEFDEYRRAIGPDVKRKKPTNNNGWFKKKGPLAPTSTNGKTPAETVGGTPTNVDGGQETGSSDISRREIGETPLPEHSRKHSHEHSQRMSSTLRVADLDEETNSKTATASTKENPQADGQHLQDRPSLRRAVASYSVDSFAPDETGSPALPGTAPAQRKGPSRAQQLIDYHSENFRKHCDTPYTPNLGKDHELAEAMLSVRTLEQLKSLNDEYFNLKDEFIVNSGYAFAVFRSSVNKLAFHRQRAEQGHVTRAIKVGTRRRLNELDDEIIFEEFTGEKWIIVRVPKDPPASTVSPSLPVSKTQNTDSKAETSERKKGPFL